jgi:excisionase family DNA binding protein
MNKRAAAELLGVSIRAVERYTAKGQLSVKYQKGKTGNEAIYNEAEVRRLKQRLNSALQLKRPAIVQPRAGTAAISRTDGASLERVIATISGLPIGKLPIVPVADKLTLSLAEASALSGLSRAFLSEAIHANKLKAAKRGRGWNIKRSDLELYIRKL